MIKQNKLKTFITSLIILSPCIVGLIIWRRLPGNIAVHFGADNAANGWSSKGFAVFGIPSILCALHILCLALTSADPKYKNIGKKPLQSVFVIIPAISVTVCSIIYASALGVKLNIGFYACLIIGLLFIFLGNMLPKARQNYSFGIKLPWTLNDADNWNRTNRFAGWSAVISGVIIILASYWHNLFVIMIPIIFTVAAPILYSYIYYRKNR